MTGHLVKIALAGLAIGSGGAAALTAVADEKKDQRSGPSDAAQIDRSSIKLSSESIADPRGGLPWAVAEYRTTDGRVCAKPGRIKDGRVGGADPDRSGQLKGTDVQVGGDCLDATALDGPVSYHISREIYDDSERRTKPKKDPLTFIWGTVRPDVVSLKVSTPLGKRQVKVDGSSYIALFRGTIVDPVVFEATLKDGTQESLTTRELPSDVKEYMLNPPEGPELERDIERRSAHP